MVKINKVEEITGKALAAGTGTDDFLRRVNETVNNLKSMLKSASDLGLVNRPPGQTSAPAPAADRPRVTEVITTHPRLEAPRRPGMIDFLDAVCRAGLGDSTPEGIWNEIRSKKLSEIAEVFKNVAKLRE